jgi:hypothetical protein
VHETVAVPDPVIVPGVIAPQVSPVGTVSDSVTVPAKLLTAVTVSVDGVEALGVPEGEVADIVKSTKLKVPVAVWMRDPLVPVTVRT